MCYCTVSTQHNKVPSHDGKLLSIIYACHNITFAKWLQILYNKRCYSALQLRLSSHNSTVMYVKGTHGPLFPLTYKILKSHLYLIKYIFTKNDQTILFCAILHGFCKYKLSTAYCLNEKLHLFGSNREYVHEK